MAKVIVLSGPPRCGKDTAAEAVVRYFGSDTVAHMKFSTPLKSIVTSVVGTPGQDLEGIKDQNLTFGGSYRDLQIATFEALSRVFSSQWLGVILANKVATQQCEYIICSDGGRVEELNPLFRAGHEIMIIQILRDGCHFGHDIRGYVSDHRAETKTILNKSREVFETQIIDLAAEFYANG